MSKFTRLLGEDSEPATGLWWFLVAVVAIFGFALPLLVGLDVVMSTSIILIYSILTLSMSYLWGYCGMLSFGQTAMYGIGGYTYAVFALNFGNTTVAVIVAILVGTITALVLGYFMIYGRISKIYFTVITLVITVTLEKAVRATSDERFTIGSVPLRGQNGISNVPDLQIPWDTSNVLFLDGVYYVALISLLCVFIGLRLLLTTHFGRVLMGIRDNERRAELLGYDSRKYQLGAFVLCGGISALAGVLYGVWGNFVAPEMMNLNSAANIVIYAIVGGRSTLVGPIAGTAIVQYLTSWLGTAGIGQVTVYLGAVLIVFVMVFPSGILPTLGNLLGRFNRRKSAAPVGKPVEQGGTIR
ncbi:branched-chain amino acid ABC transporter permease [Pseudaminobacter sp. NGMCC 1.201702]|uniref:branched-chain amino acid ABC transporter permease n=1 Tax=Pseudaminobacter sp. NGMCC 1.201702 TaxID=3391825 RepID=UPI0039EE34AC